MPVPRPAPGTLKWWVVGVIGCTLGVAVAVWLGLAMTSDPVTWTDLGYHVVDDRTVDVTYDVHRPPGRDVTCVVRALDLQFGTVGITEVDVPATSEPSVHRTDRVRTTTRAVTGVVKSCALR